MNDQVTLTREQLYELVWLKPISQLAKEYEISDVGLAKICASLNIPIPPRGYWAKLRAGRKLSRPKLPPAKDESPIELKMRSPEHNPHDPQNDLGISVEKEKKREHKIIVPEKLIDPSPLVLETWKSLYEAETDRMGILKLRSSCLDVHVSRPLLQRSLIIFNTILKDFAARGWQALIKEGKTLVEVNSVSISVRLEEEIDTVELPIDKNLSGSYSFHYDKHNTSRQPSGRLMILIQEQERLWGDNHRRRWKDSEKRLLEDRLNDVMIGLLKVSASVKAFQAQKEREAREAEEQEQKRQAALNEQNRLREALAQEKVKVEKLFRLVNYWHQSQDLRLFIDQVKQRGFVPGLDLDEKGLLNWVEWATQQADRLDPFVPAPHSILDEEEKIEHMCDGLRGYPWYVRR